MVFLSDSLHYHLNGFGEKEVMDLNKVMGTKTIRENNTTMSFEGKNSLKSFFVSNTNDNAEIKAIIRNSLQW